MLAGLLDTPALGCCEISDGNSHASRPMNRHLTFVD